MNLNKIILFLSLSGIAILSFGLIRMLISPKDILEENRNDEYLFRKENHDLNNKLKGQIAPDIYCAYRNGTILLSELVKNGPILIYRYSDINCSSCVDSELYNLNYFFKLLKNRVILLCSYEYESALNDFKQQNRLSYPVYNIKFKIFPWEEDLHDRPYYFVLHPDMRVSDFYIPEITYPKETKKYLTELKHLLLSY